MYTNMKNKIIYIIVLLCLMSANKLQAQTISASEERQFNLAVFYAMEDFDEYSKFYDADYIGEYINLFNDSTVTVYNDLLGLSYAENLPLNEYVKILANEGIELDLNIKNINKDTIYKADNGNLQMVISFDKKIEYKNKRGHFLSSERYHKNVHKVKVTFEWDSENRVAKIVSCDGSIESARGPLDENYFVLQCDTVKEKKRKSKNDIDSLASSKVLFDDRMAYVVYNKDKTIELDSAINQAIISASIKDTKFKYTKDTDIRVKVVPKDTLGNFYRLKFTPSHWRLKVYGDLSIGDFYNLDMMMDPKQLGVSSSGQEFGMEIGFICPSSKKTKFGIFIGAGLSTSKLTFGMNSLDYNYETLGEADIDGDAYNRYYSLTGVNQTITFKDLFVPLYFDFDRRFGRYFSMYLDLGVKAYLNIENDATDFSANYKTYGIYQKYDNLKLDYSSGINGFTNNGVLDASNIASPELEMESFSLDAFGRIGFRIALAKFLLLDISGGYQMSVIEAIKMPDTVAGTSGNPFVTYSAQTGKENVRNLLENAESVKRQSIKLNVGLMLKF